MFPGESLLLSGSDSAEGSLPCPGMAGASGGHFPPGRVRRGMWTLQPGVEMGNTGILPNIHDQSYH